MGSAAFRGRAGQRRLQVVPQLTQLNKFAKPPNSQQAFSAESLLPTEEAPGQGLDARHLLDQAWALRFDGVVCMEATKSGVHHLEQGGECFNELPFSMLWVCRG